MNYRNHLLALINLYAQHKALSPSRVTTLAMNSGAVYNHLVGGGDITIGRFERAVVWFSTNWPTNVDWPADVPRPQASDQSSSETSLVSSPASSLEEVVV